MNTYLHDVQGRVLQVFCDGQGAPYGQAGVLLTEDSAFYTPGACYVQGGRVHPLTPKPTPHHVFNYTTKQWEDPRTLETEWPLVRARRNALLSACDWTQLPDVPLAAKEAWAAYRQALRGVTGQPDPFNISWPQAPQ